MGTAKAIATSCPSSSEKAVRGDDSGRRGCQLWPFGIFIPSKVICIKINTLSFYYSSNNILFLVLYFFLYF